MYNLTIRINLSDEERDLLKKTFNCPNDDDLETNLVQIAEAASVEYLEMILGKQLPTRANEIHERRLFHLLKHYFRGRIPSEAEVSTLFQVTLSTSRTLLRNVRTKFKYELEEEVKHTIQEILRSAGFKSGKYQIVIQCENILEELRQIVAINAPRLDQITKVKNSAGVYSVSEDTFELLANQFEVPPNEIEAAVDMG